MWLERNSFFVTSRGAVAEVAKLLQEEWIKHYPNIATKEDITKLRVVDPELAARAEGDLKRINTELLALDQAQALAEQEFRVKFEAWGTTEDAVFAKRFEKEVPDPEARIDHLRDGANG